jgi:hypothetical protein
MSTDNDDTAGAVVAFVSGAIIGVAATLLFVRVQRNRSFGSKAKDDDYYYDGGDLFV